MSEDFYPFVDSGDPAPSNAHLTGAPDTPIEQDIVENSAHAGDSVYSIRISVYDDMLSTPRVIVVEQREVRTYLEDVTNTVYRTMKEQGGRLTLMIIRELVENFIHARFTEPVISILDNGDTIRFADQGPGISDKERAFEFGVTSADSDKKRYIRGTGAGLPMVQQYVENAGGAISVEDNLGAGTVVTVSVDPVRVAEIERAVSRGAAVRGGQVHIPQGIQGGQAAVTPGMVPGMVPMGAPQQPAPAYHQNSPVPGYQPYPGYPNPYATPAASWPAHPTAYPQMPAAMQDPFGGAVQTNVPGMPTTPAPAPHISERGSLALQFITQNGKGGPTDLARAYGNSGPTWSRELDALSGTGLIYKRGQKYELTEMGLSWVQQNA